MTGGRARLWAAGAIALALLAALAAQRALREAWERPPRLALPGGVTGVWTGRSYAYVVPATNGVVLIDAGSDPEAGALRSELQARGLGPQAVRAVLLTHGHLDHWAGAGQFPQAEVYVGAADARLAYGDEQPRALWARLLSRFARRPSTPLRLQPALAGAQLTWGDVRVQVVALPGHTPGSCAYLVDTVLFAGDAVRLVGDDLSTWGRGWSESPRHAKEILARLLPLTFAGIADGHTGYAPDGRERLARAL